MPDRIYPQRASGLTRPVANAKKNRTQLEITFLTLA
jgi:hypothetical protein